MNTLTRVLVHAGAMLTLMSPLTGLLAAETNTETAKETADKETGSIKSLGQLAREMSNPLAPFFSATYKLDYRTYQGDMPDAKNQTSISHVLEAVFPFRQKDGQGFVFKFSLPYHDDQPIFWTDRGYAEWRMRLENPLDQGPGGWNATHGHTDDVITDLVYGGVDDNGFILMYGLAGQLPTSSDTSNAKQQLILGPEINIGQMRDWGTYGALFSHVVDVVEKTDKGTPDTSITKIDAYFSYELSNGWQLYSSPQISYDWEGDSGNKLAIPLGGGFAKVTRIGKMPLRISAEIQKFVVSTDRFSSDWFFKFSITPVLANKYTRN